MIYFIQIVYAIILYYVRQTQTNYHEILLNNIDAFPFTKIQNHYYIPYSKIISKVDIRRVICLVNILINILEKIYIT